MIRIPRKITARGLYRPKRRKGRVYGTNRVAAWEKPLFQAADALKTLYELKKKLSGQKASRPPQKTVEPMTPYQRLRRRLAVRKRLYPVLRST